MSVEDRAVGALVGLACGDAVGTALEFAVPGSFEPITDMVGGGPFGLDPGQWTDDTSLALCLAESLLDRGGHDPVDQLRRYLLWFDDGYFSSTGECFDIGTTTRSQLERFRRTGEPVDPNPTQTWASNGSIMRLAGVPIRWHGDPAAVVEMAAVSSRTTHPSDRAVDACRVLGAMTAALIRGESWAAVTAPTFWQWATLESAVDEIVRGRWRDREPPAIRGSGHAVGALEAALWSVDGAVSFEDAILRAANLGDDADTTAAIAGQLAGARWAVGAIPRRWRDQLTSGERIDSLAHRLYVAGGGPPPAMWPHDEFLHGWVVDGNVLAGEYPGDVDAGVAWDKVNVLIDAGVRTFVDLTTPADGLVPYEHHVVRARACRALDVRRVSFPIPDLGVVDDDEYDHVLDEIDAAAERGGVYVHCWGGVGRTGTVAACVLGRRGLGYDAALSRISEARAPTRKRNRPCPETAAQLELLQRRLK